MMYDELWTASKAMYKLEPAVAVGGEVVIYAPHLEVVSRAHGKYIYETGYHILPYFLANWERYIHDAGDIDQLIRLAVMHYQFEAIHPFTDGNGRTGRILNLLYLVERGLLEIPVLYLSRYIIAHKQDYYRLLLAVTTDNAWEPWVLFMLEAVRDTARWSTAKIRVIRELLDQTAEKLRREAPKIYSRELAEVIFVNPYCRISDLVVAGIAKRQAASVYLKSLASLELLQEIKTGRENIYTNPALLALLSDRDNARAVKP